MVPVSSSPIPVSPQHIARCGPQMDVLAREHVEFSTDFTFKAHFSTHFVVGDGSTSTLTPPISSTEGAASTPAPTVPLADPEPVSSTRSLSEARNTSSFVEQTPVASRADPSSTTVVRASVTTPRQDVASSSRTIDHLPTAVILSTAADESPTTVFSVQTQSASNGTDTITVTSNVHAFTVLEAHSDMQIPTDVVSTAYPPAAHGLAAGTIAGISGAAVVTIVGIGVLFFLAFRRRRRRSRENTPREDDDPRRASMRDDDEGVAACPPLSEPLSEKGERRHDPASSSTSTLMDGAQQGDPPHENGRVHGEHVMEAGVQRYATDAGVRLAGGRPGSAIRDEESDEDETCTLPPSYSEIRYSR